MKERYKVCTHVYSYGLYDNYETAKKVSDMAVEEENLKRIMIFRGEEKVYELNESGEYEICPKCKSFRELMSLSRRDNDTMICDPCGTREAMEDFIGR